MSDLATKPFFQTAPDRVRVKICGITNERDAVAAIEPGADAVGLNLCSVSTRFLNLERESDWIRRLPDTIARVAVIADTPIDQAIDWSKSGLFDCLQLHGHENLAFCESVRDIPLVKAVRLNSLETLKRVYDYPVFGFLLDSHRPGSLGGTGVTFDWNLLRNVRLDKPMLVAGGLTPENVPALLQIVRPYAVDVSSGVESAPGQKDFFKMRDFVAAVKSVSSS